MDVSAILDENLDILSRPAASRAAQFLLVLSLIDRTVLPREIAFMAGEDSLVLMAAERRAQLASGQPLTARDLSARIVRFCQTTSTVQHKVRAATTLPLGFGAAELVNAQEWGVPGSAGASSLPMQVDVFSFDAHGWPVRMPEGTDAKALVSAWLLHLWMQRWLKRRTGIFGDRVLLATSAGTAREVAFHLSPETTDIMAVGPSELGRFLAAWRVVTGPWRGKESAGETTDEAS